MEEKDLEALLLASEQVEAIVLLSRLAESAIENDVIEKIWDLYPIFCVFKTLSKESLDKLRQIQD